MTDTWTMSSSWAGFSDNPDVEDNNAIPLGPDVEDNKGIMHLCICSDICIYSEVIIYIYIYIFILFTYVYRQYQGDSSPR